MTLEYPSLPEQGKNLASFTFELIKNALETGALHVSDEVKNQRLEICRACEKYDPKQIRCIECGCFLEHKASFAIDSCPLKKWEESNEEWINEKFDTLVNNMEKNESSGN
jgi:hypothetical protein